METFNIAVIGATGVGKSSLIQQVLGHNRPPLSNASSARLVVDNVTHMVTLLELDLEHFELDPNQPIQWPKQMNGHIVPRVDAALVLYDVTAEESISELPQTVTALTNTGLPAILVASKCDQPEDEWEVDPDAVANHPYFKACVATFKASNHKEEVSRACLQAITRAAVQHRRDENGDVHSRPRAQSIATFDTGESGSLRSGSDHGKHSRAGSELSVLQGYGRAQFPDNHQSQPSRSPHPGNRVDKGGNEALLDLDESDNESLMKYGDDVPLLQRGDDNQLDGKSKFPGVSFDDLVERLLAPRLSRAESNFSDIFLCLFRKFATPGELFTAILTRLDQVRDDKSQHYLSKTATQLRMIEVVAKWVSLYPGDFARPATRRKLEDFVQHLSSEPIFFVAAQQMRYNLQHNVVEDDDTGWANADVTEDTPSNVLPRRNDDDDEKMSRNVHALALDDNEDGRNLNGSDAHAADKSGLASTQFRFQSVEEYEKEAALLEPTDHLSMSKFRYHMLLEISNDDIADELTRIDWIMFSSIRIRDFVRHVSLSAADKEKCRSLKNINRIISHFNHIAQWVANMILLRDKAKHRAHILEKFMLIALKLRQLNNYNGLAAVLAGINGAAVHRLAQTKAFVHDDIHKRFARLVILMGTQKSHFAYRLAWENSPLPRIPLIPLHSRDLFAAEQNKTLTGPKEDRINWKKFEIMGEVLLPIMKSQGTTYPGLAKNDTARELILGCRMPTDDDEIYQRSVQIESATGPVERTRTLTFPWFSRSG